jgi:hypothetical protein
MRAFFNEQSLKDKYVNRVIRHRELDSLSKGATGHNGKGCAVACTLDMVYDHSRYPTELGIPEWLARVEDALFEGMSLERSRKWPEVFLRSIPLGADCDKARVPFIIAILERNIRSIDACVFDKEANPEVARAASDTRSAVAEMIRCHREGLDLSAAKSAEYAAWSAECSARSAAKSAAKSAVWSAECSAMSAAWSAESAAKSAAWSAVWSAAKSAVWSAAKSAEYAAMSAAWSAESAAKSAYDEMADELIEILERL